MDSIQAQKLEAMKNYKRAQFIYNLIIYSLTAFLSCLLYLYLFWFPSLSMNQILSILVPDIYSISPNKLLFILGNLILLFLVVSSGSQYSSSSSSPADEIYNEYAQTTRSMNQEMPKKNEGVIQRKKSIKTDHYHAAARVDSIKKKTLKKIEKESVVDNKNVDDVGVVLDAVGENHHDHNEVVTGEVEKLSSECRVPPEENQDVPLVVREDDQLKRRVEDFIARVNRQRMLEESLSR